MTAPFFASTFISCSPKNLFRLLASLPNLKSSSHTVLFSLAPAPSLAQDDLQALVSHLTALPNSLGCLAAPIRVRTRKSDDKSQTSWCDTTVCSVAAFDSTTVVPFWSEIPGKEPTQVGRWHAFRKREDVSLDYMQAGIHGEGKSVDWESVWAQKAQGVALPEGLDGLQSGDISTILYMTDGAPEGLTQSLEYFSEADKLGLVASSTPFVTGRPHTLFYNGDIRSSGAVGLAFKRPSPSLSDEAKAWSPEGKPTQQSWPNPCVSVRSPLTLEEITDYLRVTSTEGNLVHTLNDENPSRLILQALSRRKTGDSESDVDLRLKDDEFFMGVNLDKGCHEATELYQLYNIMSGDPSRGTISLQSDAAPEVGSVVKIYRASPQASLPDPIEEGLNFLTTAQSGNVEMPQPFDEDSCVSYTGAFLATSENGFVVQRPGERAWKSTVKGGQIKLTWRDPKSR